MGMALEERARDPAGAEQAGTDVGADHRARSRRSRPARAAEDLDPARRPASRPRRGPGCAGPCSRRQPSSLQAAQQVDHPLERAARGPDPLDRGDLRLDRQDRLDLQRRAEPCLRARDPPAAPQVLERVDREPQLQLGARAPARSATASASAPSRAAAAAASTTRPCPPHAVAESTTWTRSARVAELLAGLLGRADGARHAAREVDRDDVVAGVEQRLIDREEVADRRLRGRRQVGRDPAAARSSRRSR